MTTSSTPRHIFVAEDDDASRALVTKYLEGKGYRVTSAADGEAVLGAVSADDGIDLVLLDVMMPKLSGFEVLDRLRAAGKRVPIVMATAKSHPDDIVRALESGADDYITKPYSFAVLLARIALRMRPRTPEPEPATTREVVSVVDADVVGATVDDDAPGAGASDDPLAGVAPADALDDALDDAELIGGRYALAEKIGEGGFGVVYRARHVDLQQDVALKILKRGVTGTTVAQFRREAQNACRVRHENAVRVFDFGFTRAGAPYLVMELLHGITLDDELHKQGPFTVARIAHVLPPVMRALAAAHAAGIVHRDVKTSNVLLHRGPDGEAPKVLDFGIAKDLQAGEETRNVVVGSASYIAPERLRGERYDGKADVYSAGVMVFALLTGRLPFSIDNDDFLALALKHVHDKPPAPSRFVPTLSPIVDATVLRMLDKDPKLRPTADEAAVLLARLR